MGIAAWAFHFGNAWAQPFAYVSTEDGVVVIDIATNTALTTIEVPGRAEQIAISPDGTHVYVTNGQPSNSVSVIDTADNSVTADIPLPAGSFSFAKGIAITPDGARVYVTSPEADTVSVIDTASNTILQTVELEFDTWPVEVVVTPNGARVYVIGVNRIFVIDTASNTAIKIHETTRIILRNNRDGFGADITPDGSRLYWASSVDDGIISLGVIDTATNTMTTSIQVALSPWDVEINPDGTRAYVVHEDSVSVINLADNTVAANIREPRESFRVAWGAALTPDGQRLYVSNFNAGQLTVINTATNEVETTVDTGTAFTFGLAITPQAPSGGQTVTTVSAASFAPDGPLAAESIVSGFGDGLATATEVANALPLPTSLVGTSVKVTDSAGTERLAQLFFVSPGQINYLIPEGTATGPATVTVSIGDAEVARGMIEVAAVAPALFSADASGRGVAAAQFLRVAGDGTQTQDLIFDPVTKMAVPVNLGPETDQVFLLLFGTGLRGTTGGVTATVGGETVGVLGPVPQGEFVGLDQANIGPLPRSLVGRGEVEIVLTVDGQPANTVTVTIQ